MPASAGLQRRRWQRYAVREEESPGLGLGALALPWALGGLLAAAGAGGAPAPALAAAFWAALTGAALQLCLLCWPSGRGATMDGSAAAALAAGAAAVACLEASSAGAAAAAALLPAAASCAAFEGVMAYLPRTFSPGEGMAVSQVRSGGEGGGTERWLGVATVIDQQATRAPMAAARVSCED